MRRDRTAATVLVLLMTAAGCGREERGPILTGGREVKSWVAELHDPRPAVRRTAVLKLGNVGDGDPSVVEALAEALRDRDAIVRRDAVKAVAKLTTPSEAIKAQIKTMGESDRDSLVRDYAKRALGRFGETP